MSKKLELLFENEAERQVTVSVDNPTEPVNPEAIYEAMLEMISTNVLTSTGGDITAIRGARLVDRQVETIELPI
ncbi:hypothetical protein AJ85_20965 [Alkalihalobacillus alcalophilus ATCC 27647 = CGMCC 1.3604]|uniref:Potassium channel protein n=1 Tax=Alkalihalobacillus alcalophilus ATCC 27647 = CGMCC 1.3604 TaxID=1218173 RepID=A0A094WJ11_ALKAL|nr:DUF2922 domain-containing protein [Alkalihalobacillus alcalophilus]KGA96811.1 hypothetical protein BALCAV_0213825 [Alkalihalobacillus alcalophilus ATCC 27647 = CGMCC 1.3604]MED1561198.1 DUF2922 domain-containing protein [Alkalihalobacillus alcalophilus]THG88872.1 hypothetical protein AJ85_20965 [Alkalihalobacillus alcalophilus ATCC 27647 = CGMCC 1.3604]